MLPRQRMSSSGTPCEAGYLYIPVCFLALLYLVYLAECWHSRAQLSLQGHAQSLAEVLAVVQQMRSAEPVVWSAHFHFYHFHFFLNIFIQGVTKICVNNLGVF